MQVSFEEINKMNWREGESQFTVIHWPSFQLKLWGAVIYLSSLLFAFTAGVLYG